MNHFPRPNRPNTSRTPSPDPDPNGISRLTRARIQTDFTEFDNTDYCRLEKADANDITKYKMTIIPQEGMYEGGKWEFSMDVPPEYPMYPPKMKCLTQVYHPNIDLEGNICLSILRVDKDWSPVSTFNSISDGLNFLFTDPNPDSPLNVEAGEAMKKNPVEFERTVKKTLRGGRFFGKDFPKFI